MQTSYCRKVLGLDIGRHAAKAVVASRCWRGVHFRDAAWVRLPPGVEERRLVLQSMIMRNGWSGIPCVVSLPRRNAMVSLVEIDPKDPRAVGEIVSMEMDQFNGLAEKRTITSHTTQSMPDGKRGIVLAIGRREQIEQALQEGEAIGLNPVEILPAAVAMFNAVAQCIDSRSEPYAAVEIGHSGTDVVVGLRNMILFARNFPVGCGAQRADPGDGQEPALEAEAAEKWLRELLACLNLYRTQAGERVPPLKRLVVCGGGAMVEELVAIAKRHTGMEVKRLSELPGKPPLDEPDRFAVAAGLVMAGLGRGCRVVSLLPAVSRQVVALHGQRRYWILAGMAALGAVMMGVLTLYHAVGRCRNLLGNRQQELSRYHALEAKLSSLRTRNEELVKYLRPFRSAVRNGPIVQHILGRVAEAKHEDDWIILLADARSYFDGQPPRAETVDRTRLPPPTEMAADEAAGPGVRQIVIEGYTPVDDLSTVRTMIESLRTSPAIQQVDLLGDDRVRVDPQRDQRWASANCRLFAVEVTLAP